MRAARPFRGAVLGLLLIAAGCDDADQGQAAREAPPPKVTVAGIATRDVTASSRYIGQVEAVEQADLIARVDGFLEERAVSDGSFVKAGDLLFRIEPEAYEAEVAGAEADVAQLEADLALAEIELERDTRLLASNTIAQSRYDATLATRNATMARKAAAEARLRNARLRLSYTEIRAPFDGRIGRTAFSVGDVVGPAAGPIATLVRLSPVYVSLSLTEGDFLNALERIEGNLRDGIDPEKSPPIRLRLPNGSTFPETGQIVFVDNRVDPATGTIGLRARFDNAGATLAPGLFVNVTIEAREARSALVVPQAAIQRDQRGPFALVVGPQGTVETRQVTLGQQVDSFFVVEDGLQEGEAVIVEGLQRVRPGVPVEAVRSGGEG
jgi:membrane fusion protein (multidrug efflux system)